MRWLVFFCYVFHLMAAQSQLEKVVYSFSTDPIDVVIPCAPKDLCTLERCIEGIKKHGKNLRRIIVVSKERMTDRAEWFNEALFPFSKQEIALEIFQGDEKAAMEFLMSPETRIGWILQQLLKFYAPFVIPNISSNVLVLDSDVIFLKRVEFMTRQGEPYFIPGKEYVPAYFEHAARLLPSLKRVNRSHSGISHHMLLQRPVLEDLFQLIEKRHLTEPWRALCRCVNLLHVGFVCMSEYEIYFNFIQLRSNQAHLNMAKWIEIPSIHLIDHYQRFNDVIFVACPEWFRKANGFNE